MMVHLRASITAVILLGALRADAAMPQVMEDIPIPGGTAALARAIGLDSVPDRARFVAEIAQQVHENPEGRNAAVTARLLRLTRHLDAVGRFQKMLAAVQSDAGISLAMAGRTKDERNRLRDFLAFAGLKLREQNRKFTVEANGSKDAAEQVKQLADFGIDLGSLAAKLNAGENVKIAVPTETVPVSLESAVWSTVVFRRAVAPVELFATIITDARASLLANGLAGFDDETLAYVAGNPDFLRRLYEDHAAAIAAFGDTIRIRGARVVPPGGAEGVRIWEAALGETVSKPERFVHELLGQSEGRVALVYEALTHLDPARVRFAYGASLADWNQRSDQFKTLLDRSRDRSEWRVADAPFQRPVYDVATLLARVRVRANGAPAPPATRAFWHQAFDGVDIPDDPARRWRNLREDGEITAGWLADALNTDKPAIRIERLDQLSFGQRVFAATGESQLVDALIAVRSLIRFRMLMLTLERAGARDPRVYADSARRAQRIADLDVHHRYQALTAFQGAVALVDRLAKVRTIDAASAEALLKSLVALPLDEDGRTNGALQRWLTTDVAAAAGLRADAELDREVARTAAGPPESTPVTVTWERRTYRVDLAGPERSRIERAIEKMRAPSIRNAIDISQLAARMSAPSPSIADIQSCTAQLKAIQAALPRVDKRSDTAAPTGVDAPRNSAEVIGRAVQELSKIAQPKDVKKAASAVAPLSALADEWLGAALMSLTYAFDLGDPDGTVLAGGDVSRRHDFGLVGRDDNEERLRTPWTAPEVVASAGTPWHVRGSLLGLDVALARLALRRIDSGELPTPPTLLRPDAESFARSVVIVNPLDLRDTDRDAVVDSIVRGRERVSGAITPDAWDRIAAEARLDGRRRRAGQWLLAADPSQLLTLFSMSELFYLGTPAAGVSLAPWAMPADVTDACLCSQLPEPGFWAFARGRPQSGMLAAHVPDINLIVAERLRARRLPARLAPGVLAAAVQDFIETVRPLHGSDWLTLVRTAQAIADDRVDDYVAALTAGGPLVADRPNSQLASHGSSGRRVATPAKVR